MPYPSSALSLANSTSSCARVGVMCCSTRSFDTGGCPALLTTQSTMETCRATSERWTLSPPQGLSFDILAAPSIARTLSMSLSSVELEAPMRCGQVPWRLLSSAPLNLGSGERRDSHTGVLRVRSMRSEVPILAMTQSSHSRPPVCLVIKNYFSLQPVLKVSFCRIA